MDKTELIKLKYKLECIRDRKLEYKSNKYYTIINPNDICNKDISLYEIERDIDTNNFISIFEEFQEKYIRDSVSNNILYDEMRINIYYSLLVEKYELEMIKRDYEVDNRKYCVIPREADCLDNICIIGRVCFELYNNGIKVDECDLINNDNYIVYYNELKNSLEKMGYKDFKIGNFNDLKDSIFDDRKCIERLSIGFRKNKVKIREK